MNSGIALICIRIVVRSRFFFHILKYINWTRYAIKLIWILHSAKTNGNQVSRQYFYSSICACIPLLLSLLLLSSGMCVKSSRSDAVFYCASNIIWIFAILRMRSYFRHNGHVLCSQVDFITTST